MAEGLLEGTKVAGRYVVGRLLGRGGMGAVYEARHEELGRLVGLKVLLPKFAEDAELVARFFREARAAAAIHHPGIVDVFDLGRDGPLAFIVMELLTGEELTARIRFASPLGPRFVAAVGLEIAEALSAAHERGVIHRDIKPQNVFLAEHGRDREIVKILDFGIAKLTEGEPVDAQLTRTGQVFGTPLYMAPEQAHARKDLDARIDIYAIGAVLYEALAGAPPFEADSYPSLMMKIVSEAPTSLLTLRPGLPPELVALVSRAMAKDREERFPTARALADALRALLPTLPDDPPAEPRRAPAPPGDLSATAPRSTPLPEAATPPRSLAPLVQATPTPRVFNAAPPKRNRWPFVALVGVLAAGVLAFALQHDTPIEAALPVAQPAPATTDASTNDASTKASAVDASAKTVDASVAIPPPPSDAGAPQRRIPPVQKPVEPPPPELLKR